MKYLKTLIISCLVLMLTAPAVMAETSDSGLYNSKESAINALEAARSAGTCKTNSCIFDELKKANPDKKTDLWSCAVSVYYADSSASKGYRSLYQGGSTRTSFLMCQDNGVLKESYKPDENQKDEQKSETEETIKTSFSESAGTPKVDEFMDWITSGKPIYKNACREKLIEIFGNV